MKKIGLIGGTGPESTVLYYKEITQRVIKATGHRHFPELTVDSVDLYELLPLLNAGNEAAVTEIFEKSVRRLAACDVDSIAFTAVTSHLVFPQVSSLSPVPMIGIPEAVAEATACKGYRKVGVLGTIFTMEKDYLSRALIERGVQVVVPSKEERQIINNRIYNELEIGILRPETRVEFVSVIDRMKREEGIEAVVLGCTELPLILNDTVSPVPCLDAVQIHIEKLVNFILEI